MSDENQSVPVVRHAAPAASLGIPIAIVIAAALIAGAIMFTGMQKSESLKYPSGTLPPSQEQVTAEVDVAPIDGDDHIQGNPKAPIMIVEYSDYDCPFCKNFHETMDKVMNEFGADGKVAWVYRHFPLPQLHPNAPKIAEASECVAELGGNDAFWKFSDLIFGERAVNAGTDMTKLPDFAVQSGVNKDAFNKCFSSGKYTEQITGDITAAMATGAKGTPYSILIVGDSKTVINGAQPLATVRQMVQTALTNLKN